MRQPRCAWCHNSAGDLEPLLLERGPRREFVYVHREHAAAVAAWHTALASAEPSLTTGFALLPLALLAVIGITATVSWRLVTPLVGLLLVALAVVVWRHPFATAQTVTLLGIRRSVVLARSLAGALVVVGSLAIAIGIWISTMSSHER